MNDKQTILKRRSWIYVLLFLPCIVILGWILYVQIGLHDKYKQEYKQDYFRNIIVPEKRGNIYSIDSESGELLLFATDVLRYNIYIDLGKNREGKWTIPDTIEYSYKVKTENGKPKKIKDITTFKNELNALCDSLVKMFPQMSKAEYLKYFNDNRKKLNRGTAFPINQYKSGLQNININQCERIKKFPLCKYYWNGAIQSKEYYTRDYPYDDMDKMAKRTIGIQIKGSNLFDGIIGYYDSILLRPETKVPSQKIARKVLDKKVFNNEPPDIITTIDVSLQELADYSLEKQLRKNNAKEGCVVLMEVSTGYVKAISNLRIDSSGQCRELENIALTHLMQPGSTFKTLSAMVLLDKGMAKITDTVPKGKRHFPGTQKAIEDDGGAKEGYYIFYEALEHSSNVGISYLVYKNYVESKRRMQFIKDLKEYFWFDSTLKLDYQFVFNRNGKPYKSQEIVPYISKRASSVDDILRLSYGYVSMITPMQMLTFYNAIANNGVMIKPMFVSHIIREVNGERQTSTLKSDTLRKQICKPETLSILREVLKSIVDGGTAKLARTSYGAAGKTGTSEDLKTKINSASFVGYFPADKPKYSCIVVIYGTKEHGGVVAAPVFKDLADRVMGTRETYIDTSSIKTDMNSSNVVKIKETYAKVKASNSNIIEKSKKSEFLPNFIGKTAKEVMYILGNLGIEAIIEGKGRVISQSIPQGTNIKQITSVTLKLQ
ncbi:MAG: PASTA domain-containing protein [Bacteroidales bacterium]|jgi:cell division protein FtsI (penicillin-binding protein 3)|nr:PASTA domain-containing protein [Bacteroidales bacterium]